MSNLVCTKKVAFGTVEFYFLRTKINILIRERVSLKQKYEWEFERYQWLSNTIRALANRVYFKPGTRWTAPKPAITDEDAGLTPRQRHEFEKAEKKRKAKKGYNQTKMF